eukprot:m.907341 g.907341  ORF g.907341 m.907341 type:complete len:205 (-) comp60091_c0_seq1:917-1531(-)
MASSQLEHQLLQAQLLQWAYLNARCEHAFAQQKTEAEAMLYSVWHGLEERKRTLAQLQDKLKGAVHCAKLDLIISIMEKDMVPHMQRFLKFDKAYNATANVLRTTTNYLPTIGISLGGLEGAIAKGLADISDAMERLLHSANKPLHDISQFAQSTGKLGALAQEEQAIIDSCEELVGVGSSLEINERSLLLQRIQLADLPVLSA